ncbi:MAG: S8 family serine peptidase [Alphaproteobacteria bacterium]|nr:S8 family serine peptidase [Alphaproteobacteria bacterium]
MSVTGWRCWLPAILTGLLIGGMSGAGAGAQTVTPELRQAMQSATPGEEFAVIVTLADEPDLGSLRARDKRTRRSLVVETLRAHAERYQPPVIDFLHAAGARNVRPLWIVNGIAATLNGAAIDALAKQFGVADIRIDQAFSAPVTSLATTALPEWNVAMVNAPVLWSYGATGQGVVLANMDTGVDASHPDLATRWRGGTNSWFDPYRQHDTPYDANGHGTQTMGLMVGGDAGGTAIGVAPGATWIAVKIFDDSGLAYTSQVHQGFQWLVDPDGDPATDDAPDVVNNSWGYDTAGACVLEFQPDIEMLKLAGIAVVFSAGNSGPAGSTDVSPANNPSSFAAGAVDDSMTVGGFSSRGPSACDGTLFPEMVAPGVAVETADLSFGGFGFYANVSGTSFAAPHIAGGMALLSGAFPGASVADLESALRDSAIDLGAAGPDNEYGHGLIDLAAAYDVLNSPLPFFDADGDGYAAGEDCNDSDATVYPGAPEIKHDGIDQDCNGYDLTIDIVKAAYDARNDRITVEATSTLGADAVLGLSGYGAMSWNGRKRKWAIVVDSAGGNPGSVQVAGREGAVSGLLTEGGAGGSKGGRKK